MSKMNPMDLPLNWRIVRFGEVATFTKKPKDLRYSEYNEVPFVPILEKAQIPVPPLTEQEQIVSELERHLSDADAIEATLDAEIKRAERLRQSILKHAFSGKLMPQDPNDEPASVLLEKIQNEKEHQQPKRKKRATKTKIASSAKQLSLPVD